MQVGDFKQHLCEWYSLFLMPYFPAPQKVVSVNQMIGKDSPRQLFNGYHSFFLREFCLWPFDLLCHFFFLSEQNIAYPSQSKVFFFLVWFSIKSQSGLPGKALQFKEPASCPVPLSHLSHHRPAANILGYYYYWVWKKWKKRELATSLWDRWREGLMSGTKWSVTYIARTRSHFFKSINDSSSWQ